jgi:hypothetical protein
MCQLLFLLFLLFLLVLHFLLFLRFPLLFRFLEWLIDLGALCKVYICTYNVSSFRRLYNSTCVFYCTLCT